MTGNIKVLLITANVGSIFEDPNHTLKLWLKEFFETIQRVKPQFLALHCQEVGGKNYEESMQHVNQFVQSLLSSSELEQYSRVRIFLDEDFTAQEKFTALGSAYFVHNSLTTVQIWDFKDLKFIDIPKESKEVLCGNIEEVPIKEKVKFAKHFFPESQWSRKGFLRTRWLINGSIFDLINVHLFHDVSNVTALEKSPSPYSSYRHQALDYILQRIDNDQYDKYPFFLFGDLNFRLDTHSLVEKLTNNAVPHVTTGKKNEISRIQYTEGDNGKVVLTVDKKTFEHCAHNDLFSDKNIVWLREYDKEPLVFQSKVDEYPVTFPPSYPFSENIEEHITYMPTRCPSWCDRIFLSKSAKNLFAEEDGQPQYQMIGLATCMGDHKPISLLFSMKANATPGNDLHVSSNLHDGTTAPVPSIVINDSMDNCIPLVSSVSPTIESHAKVITINGDLVDISQKENCIDIHDHASFAAEDDLPPEFPHRNFLKRRDLENNNDDLKQQTFVDLAKEVKTLLHIKKRPIRPRSDSEGSSESDKAESVNKGSQSN